VRTGVHAALEEIGRAQRFLFAGVDRFRSGQRFLAADGIKLVICNVCCLFVQTEQRLHLGGCVCLAWDSDPPVSGSKFVKFGRQRGDVHGKIIVGNAVGFAHDEDCLGHDDICPGLLLAQRTVCGHLDRISAHGMSDQADVFRVDKRKRAQILQRAVYTAVLNSGIALGVERNLAVGSTVNKIVIRHLTDGGG